MATSRETVELVTKFMTTGEEDLTGAFEDIDDTLENTGDSVKNAGTRFTELASKLELAKEAFGGVQKVAEVTIETIKRGAEVEAVAGTFDNLTAAIGETSDVMLNDLRNATAGMVSDFDLMTNANRFMAMGLAESSEEAAKLSEVAVQLGAAMGTGPNQAMEEFALLLANQSIPRLDTFGISSGKVRERVNELTTGVNALDRETAFLQATMEEAEKTMVAVGDASVGTAADIARLEAGTKNLSDRFSVAFSARWAPIIGGISDAINVYEKAQQDLNKAAEAGIITQEEADKLYRAAILGLEGNRDAIRKVREELEEYNDTLENNEQVAENSANRYIAWGESLEDANESLIRFNDTTEESLTLGEMYAQAGAQNAEISDKAANAFRFQAEQAQAANEAQQALVDSVASAASIIEEGYGAEALAAEDSVQRQIEANQELVEELNNVAIAQATNALLAEGADPEDVLRAQIQLQEDLGQITSEQAEKQLEHLENTKQTAEVTDQLMSVFLEDGVLAQEESERLANAVGLIGEGAELTTEQLVTLGLQGTEHAGKITTAFGETETQIVNVQGSLDTVAVKLGELTSKEHVVKVRFESSGEVPGAPGAGGATSDVMENAGVN